MQSGTGRLPVSNAGAANVDASNPGRRVAISHNAAAPRRIFPPRGRRSTQPGTDDRPGPPSPARQFETGGTLPTGNGKTMVGGPPPPAGATLFAGSSIVSMRITASTKWSLVAS